ncbi:MAG TPA: hypothetical protein VNF74_01625 [Terriglobales bacterium]|nr:hypothetical protein [Terriglobales bacterium]
MRDQYAGDISDLLKFACLRRLGNGLRLGIGWYRVAEHDQRRDGRHREWRDEADRWQGLEPEVFSQLRELDPTSVADLQNLPFLKDAEFFPRRCR